MRRFPAAPERMRDWQTLAERIRRQPDVEGVAPYLDLQGMIGRGEDLRASLIRGIEPQFEPQVSEIGKYMTCRPPRRSAAGRAAHRARRGPRLRARRTHRRRDHRARARRRQGGRGRDCRDRSAAAHSELHGQRGLRGRHAGAGQPAGIREPAGRSGDRRHRRRAGRAAAEIRGHLRRSDAREGDCGVAGQRSADQRLVDRERQLLPRRRHREDHDDADPDADRRGRGLQHRRGAGDGRERETHGHRDPAHRRHHAARRRRRCS